MSALASSKTLGSTFMLYTVEPFSFIVAGREEGRGEEGEREREGGWEREEKGRNEEGEREEEREGE